MKTNDELFQWAAGYAAKDWRVTVCYGFTVVDGEPVCSCKKGAACPSIGKHPVGSKWQVRATTNEDDIYDALDVETPRNIGVQWGRESGVIDIEFDCDEGRRSATKFGLDRILTPMYTSKRSTHRIFKWTDKLPAVGVIKVAGLEVRIGGDSRGAQSIVPPSRHASGASYSWIEGFTPDDYEPAEIPRELLIAINNAAEQSGGNGKPFANDILHKIAGEGDRHDHLLMYCNRQALKMDDINDAVEQQELLITLRAVNRERCNPPKSDKEIETIWRDAIGWAKKKRMNGDLTVDEKKAALKAKVEGTETPDDEVKPCDSFSLTGLEYRDGEWFPGSWTLTVVHGDPVSYVLTVPVYRQDLGETRRVGVTLDAEQYRSSAKVAQAILEATHTVIVDAIPEEWATIWSGKAGKKGRPAVRGLKAKLMEVAASEAATAENCRYAAVAGWFLDVLTQVPTPDEDDEESEPGSPDVQGLPAWVRNADGVWELWFGWERAWEMANHGKRAILAGEKIRVKRMLLTRTGEESLISARHRVEGGLNRRYIKFQHRHLRQLEAISSGEGTANEVTSYRPVAE